MKYSRQIGCLIKQFREEAGYSQQELAEKLDISFQQLQKYEYGQSRITVERLDQLSSILHIPIGKLIPDRYQNADLHSISDEEEVYAPFQRVIVSPEEVKLLKLYRRLYTERLRSLLLRHIREWADIQKDLNGSNSGH